MRHRDHQERVKDEVVEVENPGEEAERDDTIMQPAHRLLAQQQRRAGGRGSPSGRARSAPLGSLFALARPPLAQSPLRCLLSIPRLAPSTWRSAPGARSPP